MTENPILDSSSLQDANAGEPTELETDLTATHESAAGSSEQIEFYVQMQGYARRDLETMIVEAGARLMLDKGNKDGLAERIQQRVVELTTEKLDKRLREVSREIVDQPVIPKYGQGKDTPMTLADTIGLYGREYLDQRVEWHSGKPFTGNSYGATTATRMEYLLKELLRSTFEKELKAATDALLREVQTEIKARHERALDDEKTRIREALAKVIQ